MRDHTIETFFMIGGTLAAGFIGVFLFGAGIPAMASAIVGFVLTVFLLVRNS